VEFFAVRSNPLSLPVDHRALTLLSGYQPRNMSDG
jgi:hypothetical protein